MPYIDVFNGDADGICALHQLRLHNPQKSSLVTGVKRDNLLLKRIIASETVHSQFSIFHLMPTGILSCSY